MLVEKFKQQKGLATAADTGNDLNHSVVFASHETVQVNVSFDRSHTLHFCGYPHFYKIYTIIQQKAQKKAAF